MLEKWKGKLANKEKADDVDTSMAKLREHVAKLSIERFHSVMELKVCFLANHLLHLWWQFSSLEVYYHYG